MEKEELQKLKINLKKQLSLFIQLPDYEERCKEFKDVLNPSNSDSINTLMDIAERLATKKEVAITLLSTYLWTYEGIYLRGVNFYCRVLIINGHDLFNFFNRKYAVSIEEISNLVATSKIQFLEEHGFSMFKREGDRKLRNKIAHYDFVIDKDGTVKIEGLSINIFQKIKDLLDFTITVDETLASCFEETNEKKQIQELLKRKDLMLPKLTDQDLE